jgi:hypothetical protein
VNTVAPEIHGTVAIHSSRVQFLQAFRQRVGAGLLAGQPHPRSNYLVVEEGSDHLRVRAADWWTAINVGLNDLELRFPEAGFVHYRVRYWRWAWFAIGLSGILGLIGLLLLVTFDVRGYIAARTAARFPGLSIDQNVGLAWAMVLFWGFVWPWLLIALHKRPLHQLVTRIIGEVDVRTASR